MKQSISETRRMTLDELKILLRHRNNSVFLLGIILIFTIPLLWSMFEGLRREEPGIWGLSFIILFCIMGADIYLYSYFSKYDMDIEDARVVSGRGIITEIYPAFNCCYCIIDGRKFRLPENTIKLIRKGEMAVIEYCEKSLHVFYISTGKSDPVMEERIQ